MTKCFFCHNSGGQIIFKNELYRIIIIDEPFYPGYLRIVLNQHLKELTDLSSANNLALYSAVVQTEKIMRRYLNPDKINIASFANMTPHVHWHVIPRFYTDRHFPNPNWGAVTNPDYQPVPQLLLAAAQMVARFESLFESLFLAEG